MMLGCEISKTGTWVFPQKMTHVEIANISNAFWEQAPKSGVWKIDLSQVTEMDSALLALLLEILRQSNARGLDLKIKGLGDNITALLKVYGIFTLFENYLT